MPTSFFHPLHPTAATTPPWDTTSSSQQPTGGADDATASLPPLFSDSERRSLTGIHLRRDKIVPNRSSTAFSDERRARASVSLLPSSFSFMSLCVCGCFVIGVREPPPANLPSPSLSPISSPVSALFSPPFL